MKLILSLIIATLSTSAFAIVDSKNCPDNFYITFYNISRSVLTSDIRNNSSLKAGWDTVKEAQKLEQEFKIIKRTETTSCVYSNGNQALYLWTNNNAVDELVVPYKNNLYFRTKVLSFANDYIELAIDEDSKKILVPIMSVDSNGGTKVTGEVEVGEAEAVNIQVL